MRGLRLDEHGRLETVTWADEGESLDALQEAVGGWVDVVQLTSQVSMWVNDEGAYRCGLNRSATRVTMLHGDTLVPIFGPVIFTGCRGFENETVGLPTTAEAWLRGWAAGRCTSVEQRDGRAVTCGAVEGHPDDVHEAVVGEELWIWVRHGSSPRSMAELEVTQ